MLSEYVRSFKMHLKWKRGIFGLVFQTNNHINIIAMVIYNTNQTIAYPMVWYG